MLTVALPQVSIEPEGPMRAPKLTIACLGAAKPQGYLNFKPDTTHRLGQGGDVGASCHCSISRPPLIITYDRDHGDCYLMSNIIQ